MSDEELGTSLLATLFALVAAAVGCWLVWILVHATPTAAAALACLYLLWKTLGAIEAYWRAQRADAAIRQRWPK